MSFIILVLIFVLLVINIRFGRYGQDYYWFFEFSHFLMGFLIASFLFSSIHISNTKIVSVVLIVGILWEFWEYISYNFLSVSRFIKKHFNYFSEKQILWDTVLDLILDLSGALFFIILHPVL